MVDRDTGSVTTTEKNQTGVIYTQVHSDTLMMDRDTSSVTATEIKSDRCYIHTGTVILSW